MSKKNDVIDDEIDQEHLDELEQQELPPLTFGVSADGDEAKPEPEPEKKPEPKPGDKDYDWVPHYPAAEADLYTHTFPDGTVVAIRTFGSIYSKTWLYKLRKAQTDTDIQFAAIDRAACDTAQALIEGIEAPLGGKDPIDELWEAWSQAGTAHVEGAEGLSTGESRG